MNDLSALSVQQYLLADSPFPPADFRDNAVYAVFLEVHWYQSEQWVIREGHYCLSPKGEWIDRFFTGGILNIPEIIAHHARFEWPNAQAAYDFWVAGDFQPRPSLMIAREP